ncbi:MAG: ATP-binding cassette domain-containing protein [Spirochaetales bacterium]
MKPPTLSGGEKQRVSIARAFAHPCNTLLMDEAFQSLDLRIKFQLMELFSSLIKAEKKTVLLVTHDIREALCLADRIIVCIGTPMSICFDTKISHQDDKKSMAHTYINLSEENLSIQKKILDILS